MDNQLSLLSEIEAQRWGIPGLIGWFSIFLGVCLTAWQLYRYGKTRNERWTAALGAGFLGSQIALVTHGLMDAVTWGMIRPAPLVWGLWGTAVAAWMIIVVPQMQVNEPLAESQP